MWNDVNLGVVAVTEASSLHDVFVRVNFHNTFIYLLPCTLKSRFQITRSIKRKEEDSQHVLAFKSELILLREKGSFFLKIRWKYDQGISTRRN